MAISTWALIIVITSLFVFSYGQMWSTGEQHPNNQYPPRNPIGVDYQNTHHINSPSYGVGNSLDPFFVQFEWSQLDFNWIDEPTRAHAITNRKFIPENNAISGIKVWRDRIFLTVPRMRPGVPVTLATIPAYPQSMTPPRLEPFPNWSMQEVGNCTAFQSIQGIEIDTEGRIWILDTGRINTIGRTTHQSRCPPKLVIIDLHSVRFPDSYQSFTGDSTNPIFPAFQNPNYNQQYPNNYNPNQQNAYPNNQYNPSQYPNQQYPIQQYPNQQNSYGTNQYNPSQYPNNQQNPNQFNNQYNNQQQYRGGFQNQQQHFGAQFRIVKTHIFPSLVVDQYSNNMNSIVLDNSNGWFAYMADNSDDPGIVVYSFMEDRSWKVKDVRSMKADLDVDQILINNINVDFRDKHLRGLCLSPVTGYDRTLYFSPLGSYNLYSVPTSTLKNPNLPSDISSSVTDHGRKMSLSDGLIMDNRAKIYFGLLTMNAVGVWNTRRGKLTDAQRIMSRDNRALQWVNSFDIDDMGYMYIVSNRLQNYITNRVGNDEPNYRILKAPIGSRSYLYFEDMTNGVSRLGPPTYYDFSNYYPNAARSLQTAQHALVTLMLFILGR